MCAKLFSKKAQVEICIVVLTVKAFCYVHSALSASGHCDWHFPQQHTLLMQCKASREHQEAVEGELH